MNKTLIENGFYIMGGAKVIMVFDPKQKEHSDGWQICSFNYLDIELRDILEDSITSNQTDDFFVKIEDEKLLAPIKIRALAILNHRANKYQQEIEIVDNAQRALSEMAVS